MPLNPSISNGFFCIKATTVYGGYNTKPLFPFAPLSLFLINRCNSLLDSHHHHRRNFQWNRYNHWRPPQGADPTMDTHDWRAQLLPHIRQTNVNEIMTKLKIRQFHGDDNESLDVEKISKSFEQKTYAGALSQEDYLQKISSMMRLIDSCRCRWRVQLQPASRQRIVNKLTDLLKKSLPFSDEEGLAELHRIALRFEEKIYTAATSQADYLRKISLKMLTINGQNTVANSMPSNLGPSETGSASGAQV